MPAGAIIFVPEVVLQPECYRKLGSANIFVAKTLDSRARRPAVHVVSSMCSSASLRRLSHIHIGRGEEVMRGGVPTGHRWIFFAYKRSKQESCYVRTKVGLAARSRRK